MTNSSSHDSARDTIVGSMGPEWFLKPPQRACHHPQLKYFATEKWRCPMSVHNRFPSPRPQASGDGLLQCRRPARLVSQAPPRSRSATQARQRHVPLGRDAGPPCGGTGRARHSALVCSDESLQHRHECNGHCRAFSSRGAGLRRRRFRVTTGPAAGASHEEIAPGLGLGVITQYHLYSLQTCWWPKFEICTARPATSKRT